MLSLYTPAVEVEENIFLDLIHVDFMAIFSPAHGANARAHELHNCVRGFHYNHAFSFSLTTVEVEKTFLRLIHFHCMCVGREVGF